MSDNQHKEDPYFWVGTVPQENEDESLGLFAGRTGLFSVIVSQEGNPDWDNLVWECPLTLEQASALTADPNSGVGNINLAKAPEAAVEWEALRGEKNRHDEFRWGIKINGETVSGSESRYTKDEIAALWEVTNMMVRKSDFDVFYEDYDPSHLSKGDLDRVIPDQENGPSV